VTVKQFLKSKAFKCILVLLCIALVAGGLLAVFNDLLKVTDEEKTARAIKEIHGAAVGYTDKTADFADLNNRFGAVLNVFLLSDGAYLLKSKGIDGYKGGTVTVWVAFEDNKVSNVVFAEQEKQTLMSGFKTKFYSLYKGISEAEANELISGATHTSRAINNAVNCAALFYRSYLLEGAHG